jgi:hypothetical protein
MRRSYPVNKYIPLCIESTNNATGKCTGLHGNVLYGVIQKSISQGQPSDLIAKRFYGMSRSLPRVLSVNSR